MNFDGLWGVSPTPVAASPEVEEAALSTKVVEKPADWLSAFAAGVGKSSEPEASSSKDDWLANFTVGLVKVTEGTTTTTKEAPAGDSIGKPIPANNSNDWLGNITGTIGFGVVSTTGAEPEEKPREEDWFASIAGGLGFPFQKEENEIDMSKADDSRVDPKRDTQYPNDKSPTVEKAATEATVMGINKVQDENLTENMAIDLSVFRKTASNRTLAQGIAGKEPVARRGSGVDNKNGSQQQRIDLAMEHKVPDQSSQRHLSMEEIDLRSDHVGALGKSAVTDQEPMLHGRRPSQIIAPPSPPTTTTTMTTSSGGDTGEPTGSGESKQAMENSDTLRNDAFDSTKDTEVLADRPQLKRISFVASVRNVLGFDDIKDDGSEGSTHSLTYSVSVAPSVHRPQLNRNTTETMNSSLTTSARSLTAFMDFESARRGSFGTAVKDKDDVVEKRRGSAHSENTVMRESAMTNSTRSLHGLADHVGSATKGGEDAEVKDKDDAVEKTAVTQDKDFAKEAADGIMNFFGSLLGQPTTTFAKLQRHETSPGDLMESEQSSESSDDRVVRTINETNKEMSVVGNQRKNETAKSPTTSSDLQAHIKEASETISGWVSGVQAFVSHQVAEITDKVLVIPRHPKAHKSRAAQKKWWSFSSYTKSS